MTDRVAARLPHEVVDGVGVTLAHEAGVHVQAEAPVPTERPVAAVEGHGGVHAAADQEEDLAPGRLRPDLVHHLLDASPRIPVLRAAADVEDEVAGRSRCRTRVWTTSGWNCSPNSFGAPCSAIAAIWQSSVRPMVANPSGALVTVSPWLIQTVIDRSGSPSRYDALLRTASDELAVLLDRAARHAARQRRSLAMS